MYEILKKAIGECKTFGCSFQFKYGVTLFENSGCSGHPTKGCTHKNH